MTETLEDYKSEQPMFFNAGIRDFERGPYFDEVQRRYFGECDHE